MSENRKIAAILAADVVGFSRLAAVDEDRTLARLRALRSDLIDPTVAVGAGTTYREHAQGRGPRAMTAARRLTPQGSRAAPA
jgi:adenylate cyclase